MDSELSMATESTYVFNGDITSESAGKVIKWLLDNAEKKELTIILTTGGGSVDQALTIHETIQSIKSTVRIVAMGMCLSAGMLILCATELKNRFTTTNTRFMTHAVGLSFSDGQRYACGPDIPDEATLHEMETITGAGFISAYALQEVYVSLLTPAIGLDEGEVRELFQPVKRFFSATTALEWGIVGHVIPKKSVTA